MQYPGHKSDNLVPGFSSGNVWERSCKEKSLGDLENRVRAEMRTLFDTNGKKGDATLVFYFLSHEHQSNRWRILQSGKVVEIFLNFFNLVPRKKKTLGTR